jgi:Ala-tRNA(Pro) deacylase
MEDIFAFLQCNGIAYEQYHHPAVFTCEEAEQLVPDMRGMHTKNLFLKDKKGKQFFLVLIGYGKVVDLKSLAKVVGAQGLRFASPEDLQELLGVGPGSVSLLGLVEDKKHAVHVIIDSQVWEADAMQCHPLVNTQTLVLQHEAVQKFLQCTGHKAAIEIVPSRL